MLVREYLKVNSLADLGARKLGSVRSELKRQLATELDAIDAIVGELSSGKSMMEKTATKKRRKTEHTGRLFD